MMDVDRCKRYVLTRNGEYLMHNPENAIPLRWTNSPYTAEQYKDRRKALDQAKIYGAKIRVFNPVTGEIRYG